MEVLRPVGYWTLWMSERHTVTWHHFITVYKDMLEHMDGVVRGLAKKKNLWKEDLYFTGSLHAWSYPKIILKLLLWLVCCSFQHIFLIISGSCHHLGSGAREWILILRTRHLIPPNARRHFWSVWKKIIRQISTIAHHWTRKFTMQESFLSDNGFEIWSIILWSIWFVQRW